MPSSLAGDLRNDGAAFRPPPGTSQEARQKGRGSASIHHCLGVVAQEQRKWEAAASHYREALRIYDEFQDRYSQASTYGQLGKLAQEQGKWDPAGSHLLEALLIFREAKDDHSLGIALRSLARLASELPAVVTKVAEILDWSPGQTDELFQKMRDANAAAAQEPPESGSLVICRGGCDGS